MVIRMPDRERWLAYFRFLGVFLLAFIPVYLGAGYLNGLMPERAWRIYVGPETEIPLVAWMVWPYLSLYTVYALPLLHLDPLQMRRLTLQSVTAVVAAGVVFLALPSRSGFAPVPVDGLHGPMVRLIALVDTPFNLVPSLHVTCAALILVGCCEVAASPVLRRFYLAWLALLAVSTVLVHQHHLIDVATGFALAAAVRWAFPLSGARAAR